MAKPSDCWSNSEWNEFGEKGPKFANIKRGRIPIVASKLRSGIPCKLSSRYTKGSFNVIFEVEFDDSVIWICRIRHMIHTKPRSISNYRRKVRWQECSTYDSTRTFRFQKSMPSKAIRTTNSEEVICSWRQ